MKKLIFLRDGVGYRLYMEQMDIFNIHNLDIDIGTFGYKKAVEMAQKENDGFFSTLCPTILQSIDWWNDEERKFEIYIPNKKGKLKNIQEFTNRELRRAHNVEKMFLGGEFDD